MQATHNPFSGQELYYVCGDEGKHLYSGLYGASAIALQCKARGERVWVEDAYGYIVPEIEQVKAIIAGRN